VDGAIPKPKEAKKDGVKKEKEGGEKKDKKDGPLQFNIGEEHMEFLKGLATKYEIKGLNSIAKALLAFAKDDPDNEVFKNAPESKPEKLIRLRLNLTPAELALVEKAQAKFEYPNRHIPMQALIRFVTPDAKDPAEKGAQEAMLDDIFKDVPKDVKKEEAK